MAEIKSDGNFHVVIADKEGASLSTQTVEAYLLLEILVAIKQLIAQKETPHAA